MRAIFSTLIHVNLDMFAVGVKGIKTQDCGYNLCDNASALRKHFCDETVVSTET